jgi:hypothetical protein
MWTEPATATARQCQRYVSKRLAACYSLSDYQIYDARKNQYCAAAVRPAAAQQ